MNHLKLEQKRQLQKIKIITWITCVISTVMVCMSLDKVSDYKGFVLQILLCLIGTIATFHKKVSVKKASYYFLIWLFINNMTSSLVERQIYAVIIVLILNIILFEGFQDRLLVFLHCAGSVLLILYHFLFENTFNKDVIIDHILVTVSVISIASGAYYSMTHIKLKNKMERQLYDSVQDAKVAEREKTAFLANMSHEIRTPMNAIIGMCELMLREPDCSDSAKEYGAYIQNAGSNLLAIVNDVLDYSKIESGKMEILEEEFNLASVVNDVVNMITMRIGGKDLELIVHVDPEIPNTLMGDEIRLRQVIINLLTNAVKYTREGAVILTISFMRRGYGINLNVSVKDTGIGISPENLEKLFSSFQQVDTKRNRAVEGTGLGLALSKKLIMQMGGFINVSSVLDEGSEFRFSVPLKVKDESHFVDVKDADNVFVVALIGTPKYYSGVIGQEYQKLVNELGEKLHVSHALYRDFERLKNRITKGNITHCFVGREEYLQHKAYFDNLLEDMDVQVVVMHRRTQEVHVASSVKRLYKPAYALSIVSVLNDENVALNMSKSTTFETDFAASKAKILLVDDNAVNLKVAEGLLRPYRVQITSVASGKAAISKLRDNKYDLVFMDHMMPEMDGVEALRVIRKFEDPYYQDMPVIALTANTTGEARKQLLEAGFQDFVSKPIETKKLEMVLRKWLPEELRDKSDAPSLKQPESEQPVQEAVGTAISKLIDPSVGVSYVGDDMELYREILGLYVEKGPESIAEINDCYEKEKWKDYVICVHALKSASLSIGAVTLSNQAKALELSGKQNNILYIKQHHSEMIESYQETLKQADQMLREESL